MKFYFHSGVVDPIKHSEYQVCYRKFSPICRFPLILVKDGEGDRGRVTSFFFLTCQSEDAAVVINLYLRISLKEMACACVCVCACACVCVCVCVCVCAVIC